MSKKKSKSKKDRYADAPIYAPASKADRGFPCVRCGAPLSSPADQHNHNLDTHLNGARS